MPYDISLASFAITTGDVEIDADELDPDIEGNDVLSDASSGVAETGLDKLGLSVPAAESPAGEAGGTALMTLSDPREGCFYIYSFDGRLLAEYDVYGECLKDYIYMGARLVAEFKPATAEYFYYTQDQIGSTRVVTNDAGAVVYAEAHDPYGGIQKTWVNNFEPKRKFSDKERDEETDLDYFGARYFANTNYRWISIDPLIIKRNDPNPPAYWNLYSFCLNNPLRYRDPTGREAEAQHTIYIYIGFDMSFTDLDFNRLTRLRLMGYTVNVYTTWTIADFRASAAASNTSTFFVGHSNIQQVTKEGPIFNGIVAPDYSRLTKDNPIIANNKYIGIFGCNSASYMEDLVPRKTGMFALSKGGGSDASAYQNVEGYWEGAYVLICRLFIDGQSPAVASRKATERIDYRLNDKYRGEYIVWW